MRLGHIEMFVRDPLASRDFFRDVLGFQVLDVQADQYVWLRLGQQEILLRPDRRAERPGTYRDASVALVLYTDDLDREARELEARGLEFHGSEGSDRCLTFQDPDGHWFQLVDPGEQ